VFTQPDPIGLAGGLNLYGYAGGDPVNFSDPFGLKIIKRYSAETARQIDEARKDSTFNAHWEAMEADTANFLIFDDSYTDASSAWGIHDGGPNLLFDQVQAVGRSKNVSEVLRGYIRIGTMPGSDPQRCTVPHEIIHLLPYLNGGVGPKLPHSAAEFRRPYFAANGCRTP
jgi:hypothetical protein